jgi:hypothetical protein
MSVYTLGGAVAAGGLISMTTVAGTTTPSNMTLTGGVIQVNDTGYYVITAGFAANVNQAEAEVGYGTSSATLVTLPGFHIPNNARSNPNGVMMSSLTVIATLDTSGNVVGMFNSSGTAYTIVDANSTTNNNPGAYISIIKLQPLDYPGPP